MKLSRKISLWIAGVLGAMALFVIGLMLALPSFVDSDMLKKKIQAFVVRETGGTIDFQKAELVSFPRTHIVFREVRFSLPDKAAGSVQSLDIYPEIWMLLRGKVKVAKISVESPSITVALSEEEKKLSLEEIEGKIRSVLRGLRTIAPDISITVHKGKLDLTKRGATAFTFETIQSSIAASEAWLNLSATSTSNLWRSLSLQARVHTEDLKIDGSVQAVEFRSHELLIRTESKIAGHIDDSGADLFARFKTVGLRKAHADITGSVPALVVTRGKERALMKKMNIKGSLEFGPERVAAVISEFSSAVPGIQLSGNFTLDRSSGSMGIGVEGKSIDVQSVRSAALSLGEDIPVIRTIFDIMQGGRISLLRFSTRGKSPVDLGRLDNMRISGAMTDGDIYIRARDLRFQNVKGNVVIARGILSGDTISASLDGHKGSQGTLAVGLKGKDAPFHLVMQVEADAGRLPLLLRQKQLIKNEAVLREMDRLSDLHGIVQGTLVLGDRLNAIHVVTDISRVNLVARYEPLPFPLRITGGQIFFDEKSVKTTDLSGSIGSSSFAGLTAGIGLDDQAPFEISRGRMNISADELYPWVTSFETIRPVLTKVPSVKGMIALSSVSLQGPLYRPKEWKYFLNGDLHGFTLDSTFFPGRMEETSGTFRLTNDELSLNGIRTKMTGSVLNVSGTISAFPADIRSIALSLQGEVGPVVTDWIARLAKLPEDISFRAPLSVSASNLVWEKAARTSFDGTLVFSKKTQVSLRLTKTPDELVMREISVKDKSSDAAASIMLNNSTADIAFKGTMTPDTFSGIFAGNAFSGVSLKGDFTTHIILKDPKQSVAEGILEGKNIRVPWGRDVPLVIRDIHLDARGKKISVNPAQISIGDEHLTGRGIIDISGASYSVDMDIASDGFRWDTFEKIAGGTKKTEGSTNKKFPGDFPLKGTLRIQSDFFSYRQFTWKPFHADISIDGEKIHIISKKAALCGVSTTGDIDITPNGAEIEVALSAKNLELQPTILCISDKRVDVTGRFEMKAALKAKGKLVDIAKSLNGSFTISAKKGKIFKSQALNKTLDLVNETENVKEKLPDLDKTIIDYRSFTANGTIKENIVEVDESILDTTRFGILAQGKVDLQDQTLDMNALVAPMNRVQRLVGKIPILGKVLGGSLVSVPVKIKGKLSDPQVNFLSASAIGSAFFGIIERTVKLPVTIIEPILPEKK